MAAGDACRCRRAAGFRADRRGGAGADTRGGCAASRGACDRGEACRRGAARRSPAALLLLVAQCRRALGPLGRVLGERRLDLLEGEQQLLLGEPLRLRSELPALQLQQQVLEPLILGRQRVAFGGDASKLSAGRGRLPAHLPRVEVVLAPEATACPCCQSPLVEIGADAAERLDVGPAQFRVLVTKRPKLACRACPGVVLQAPAPARLIEGGVPTEATVAHVLVSRYADHLPLYRQAQILARQGMEIGREVLADWTGTGALEIVPVVRRMREILLASPRLFADETTMPVLDPGRGKTKKGYAWAIARDDRPWGGADPPAVVFHYAPGRGA